MHRYSHGLQLVVPNLPHMMGETWAADQVAPCAVTVGEDCEVREGTIARIVCQCKATLTLWGGIVRKSG